MNHTIKMTQVGKINNESYKLNGRVVISPTSGVVDILGEFDLIPSGFHPFAVSGYSAVCNMCGRRGKKFHVLNSEKTADLGDATGGSFECLQEVIILDKNKIIGEVSTKGKLIDINDNFSTAEVKIEGFYRGPIDITFTPGYYFVLRQLGPGKIEGVYSQQIFTHSGKIITSSVRRLYTYQGDTYLPFPEIAKYKVKSMKLEGLKISQKGIMTFFPAEMITPLNRVRQ